MRECGMLMPVSALWSKYGIGTFSREAYEFVDTLKQAGQKYWQILPLGPTGYGDSPYQSFSAFAGNPYFIDLDRLAEEGLLSVQECREADFGDRPDEIDYKKLYENRYPLLRKAYQHWDQDGHDIEESKQGLLPETIEYCQYMAIKDYYGGLPWSQWEDEIRLRKGPDLELLLGRLKQDIGFYVFLQLKFQEQWKDLKQYANEKGIKVIGDIPIYVAFDSSDSWCHPELFQFDDNRNPLSVAGCPPDAFSSTGQLWGNPLYHWGYHKKTGYEWWMKRIDYSFHLYDVVRIDHFRGFDEYYSIPYGNPTAETGRWEPGPGMDFFYHMKDRFGEMRIIAEDLGFLTPSVLELLKDTGFPGMKVLEFAFNSWEESSYLPHNYIKNCVVYTGTHDNDTVHGWYEMLHNEDKKFLLEYINASNSEALEVHWDLIRLALASAADLAIIPVQDYLGLGSEARINQPSTLGQNWKWRLTGTALSEEMCSRCRHMANLYGRR